MKNNIKIKIICLFILVILFSFVTSLIFFDKFFFKVETEKIFISNNCIFIVKQKVPIEAIQKYHDLFRVLNLDSFLFAHIDPTLEKYSLDNGELIEKKESNFIYHNGYFEGGFIVDIKTSPGIVEIQSLFSVKSDSQIFHTDIDAILYDSAKNLFYAKFNEKIIKLTNSKDIESYIIPLEPYFDCCDIYNGLLLLRVYKANEKNICQHQIYDLTKNAIKGLDLKFDEWSLNGLKNLKLIGHKIGTGDFFMIELVEHEKTYQINSIQKLHNSIGICDFPIWDKKNNKIYFYNSGEAHFQEKFDVYQYDDDTLKKTIIHVNLK